LEKNVGLDTVELVLGVEEAFEIKISDEDAPNLTTVGKLHLYIVSQLRAKGEAVSADKIYDQLRALVVEHSGVKPEKVVRDARFVQDLNMD
jgi:acyl carrier protein